MRLGLEDGQQLHWLELCHGDSEGERGREREREKRNVERGLNPVGEKSEHPRAAPLSLI